jgi:formyltetrahydrofolate-dependent phosphoribosylglycinamide formyltransferase
MPPSPLNLAVLLSGGGRTLQNFIDLRRAGRLPIQIPLVIGSRPDIRGLERARQANIPQVHAISRKDHPSVAEFSRRVFSLCDEHKIDLICLAGWLSLLDIPDGYNDCIMNIHPALLPAFGGKGMFGHHVHQAVIDHGCKVSGCTVHFCDNAYDTGPIIIQRTCPVLDDDTPDTLAKRVFEEEMIAYPEAIRLYAEGRLKIEGRRVIRSS